MKNSIVNNLLSICINLVSPKPNRLLLYVAIIIIVKNGLNFQLSGVYCFHSDIYNQTNNYTNQTNWDNDAFNLTLFLNASSDDLLNNTFLNYEISINNTDLSPELNETIFELNELFRVQNTLSNLVKNLKFVLYFLVAFIVLLSLFLVVLIGVYFNKTKNQLKRLFSKSILRRRKNISFDIIDYGYRLNRNTDRILNRSDSTQSSMKIEQTNPQQVSTSSDENLYELPYSNVLVTNFDECKRGGGGGGFKFKTFATTHLNESHFYSIPKTVTTNSVDTETSLIKSSNGIVMKSFNPNEADNEQKLVNNYFSSFIYNSPRIYKEYDKDMEANLSISKRSNNYHPTLISQCLENNKCDMVFKNCVKN